MCDRLIELIQQADDKCGHTSCGECGRFGTEYDCLIGLIADYLLANGVIVPPCKVGDTVWVVNKTAGKVFYNTVVGIFVSGTSPHKNGVKCEYRNICGETSNRKFTWAQFGRQVFHSREEAEAALKEKE